MAHQKITLLSLLLTVLLNLFLFGVVQKGFFPNQDTGLLMGALRADQNISFQAMKPKMRLILLCSSICLPAYWLRASISSSFGWRVWS